jgi:hypothetical protein
MEQVTDHIKYRAIYIADTAKNPTQLHYVCFEKSNYIDHIAAVKARKILRVETQKVDDFYIHDVSESPFIHYNFSATHLCGETVTHRRETRRTRYYCDPNLKDK